VNKSDRWHNLKIIRYRILKDSDKLNFKTIGVMTLFPCNSILGTLFVSVQIPFNYCKNW